MGFFANETIEEDELILEIETPHLITVQMAFETLEGQMELNDFKLDCTDTLALLIATEMRKKENSPIWPYIHTLPSTYDTPLEFWPAKFDKFLTGHVLEAKQTSVSDFEIRYERIQETFNKKNPRNVITADEFHYAYAAVYTRYFNFPTPEEAPEWFWKQDACGAIGPVFDMLNHNWYANCEWWTDDGMLIKTNAKIEEGQELFISYGKGCTFIHTVSLSVKFL